MTLDTVPSFYGITVGMVVSGLNIGANVTLPGAAGEAGAVANTIVTAVSGNTVTLSFVPGGYGTLNNGVLGPIPAGTTLTFSVPAENTNFLEAATGEANSATNNPFTYAYEFNQSKLLEQQKLGTTIYGAAVPGAAETYATVPEHPSLLSVCRRNSDNTWLHRLCDRRLDRHRFRLPECVRLHEPDEHRVPSTSLQT